MCRGVGMEDRGQLGGIPSLLPPRVHAARTRGAHLAPLIFPSLSPQPYRRACVPPDHARVGGGFPERFLLGTGSLEATSFLRLAFSAGALSGWGLGRLRLRSPMAEALAPESQPAGLGF